MDDEELRQKREIIQLENEKVNIQYLIIFTATQESYIIFNIYDQILSMKLSLSLI